MVTRASGIDRIMAAASGESFVGSGKSKRKARTKKPVETDERDPAVVALQGADLSGTDQESPNGASEAPEGVSGPAEGLPVVLGNGAALAARSFFSDDGWLALPKDLPFDHYQELVSRFSTFRKNMLWVAGDLQTQGEELYGEQYAQVLEMLAGQDYKESTLSVAKLVSEKFPPADRVRELSWNHHMVVMSFPKKERKDWLRQALAGEWSVKDLKRAIELAGGTPTTLKARKGGDAHTTRDAADNAPAASEPKAGAAAQPVTVRGVVTLEMLNRADEADKAWYEALDAARKEMEAEGTFDHEALNAALRVMAAELIALGQALGGSE